MGATTGIQGVIKNVGTLPGFAAIKADTLPGPLATTYVATGESPGYYALPDDTNTQALFWNKTDFAAAGISGPPKTLSAMYADAAKLTNTAKQQYGLGVDGTDMWNMAPFVWSAGGSFTNKKYTTATGAMNSPKTIAAVQSLVSLLNAGDIGSDFAGGASKVSGEQGFPTVSTRCTSTGLGLCRLTSQRIPSPTTASPRSRPARRVGLHSRRRGSRDPVWRASHRGG